MQIKDNKIDNLTQIKVRIRLLLAEKEGFEPSLRSTHTTPLAGEPLRPLGYFSKLTKLFYYLLSCIMATLLRAGGRRVKQIVQWTVCSQSGEQTMFATCR